MTYVCELLHGARTRWRCDIGHENSHRTLRYSHVWQCNGTVMSGLPYLFGIVSMFATAK